MIVCSTNKTTVTMGNSLTKSRTKSQTTETKKNKTEVQRQITTQNKQHIKKIHKSADEKFKNNEIDRNTYLNISHTLQRGEDLIDRGSKGLVKDDYIVIICMLKPEYMPQKTLLSNKKNDDLIFIICSIIYDVNAIETKMNNSIVNVNTITANNTKQIEKQAVV